MLKYIKQTFQSFPALCSAIAVNFIVVLLDYISTISNMSIRGLYEGNPFARHANLSFYWQHALVGDLLFFSCYLFIALGIYECSKRAVGTKIADMLATIPFLYISYDRLTDAVFHNILFHLGYFVGNPFSG